MLTLTPFDVKMSKTRIFTFRFVRFCEFFQKNFPKNSVETLNNFPQRFPQPVENKNRFLGKIYENQGFSAHLPLFLGKTWWRMWINFSKFSPKADVEKKITDRISHFGDLWKKERVAWDVPCFSFGKDRDRI